MQRIKYLSHQQLNALSENELKNRRSACRLRATQWFVVRTMLLLFAIGFTYTGIFQTLNGQEALLMMLAAFVTMATGVAVNGALWLNADAWSKELTPLSESESGCLDLLDAVQQYPQVKAWVDTAVSTGRQLRFFDLDYANALRAHERQLLEVAEQQRAQDAANERKQRHVAACRVLHGLPVA